MEDFQFIIETPQTNVGQKKRPRLVTSCDNCRLKKIKCLQPSADSKCEACKAAKIQCRFKDRERYFAERSRAIAGPSLNSSGYPNDQRTDTTQALDAFSVASSSSSPALSNSALRSNSHSPKASGLVSPEADVNNRYPYPTDPRRPDANYGRHSANSSISSFHSRSNSYGYSTYVPSPAPVLHQTHDARLPPAAPPQVDYRQTFDPDRPEYPHSSLMQHFFQIFFESYGREYPFLSYTQLNDYWDGRMPPSLANCIASLASRYSNIPELTIRGLHNVAEAYYEVAKNLVAATAHIPSIDTLHAIIILAWTEYKASRIQNSRNYCQSAVQMGQDLGLPDNDPNMQFPESERRRRQETWANILNLHNLLATVRA